MSEESQLLLCGKSVVPPEELDYDVTVEDAAQDAIFKSSAVNIRDSIGKSDFRENYYVLKQDILDQNFVRQKRFVENCFDKIEEVYDFKFPEQIDITTQTDINEFMEFLEFLEFNNIEFFANIWRILDVNLLKTDIEDFCQKNAMKIIKEVEDQIESYDYNEMINLFLRTYYKDKFIEWFVKNTTQSKIDIYVEQIGV